MSAEVNPNHESQDISEDRPLRSPKPISSPLEIPPLPHPNLDPEVNSAEEDDDDEEEGEEVDEAQERQAPGIMLVARPIGSQQASAADVTLASLTGDANTRRGATKPKKGKWKGKGKSKGKPHIKKQQAIDEKLRRLVVDLNPIPFAPSKIPDFARHEALLKKLGLWDVVHIDFDKDIRADLIAHLVALYEVKSRASYVYDIRIRVNRADLARALRLPLKRGNAGVDGVDVDLDSEVMSNESIQFMQEFLRDWVLLHDDIWIMPKEMTEWLKMVEEGHPEKVDWAGLFWFMVEKELKQGGNLRNCYYASHMQHLIKSQREELFHSKDMAPAAETVVDLDAEVKEKGDRVNEEGIEACASMDIHEKVGPSTELTLGQDGEKEDRRKDVNMRDVEECKASENEDVRNDVNTRDVEDCKASDEEGEVEEHCQWLLDGRNNLGEHFMQPCDAGNDEEFGGIEDRKEEGDEEGDEEEEEEAEEEMDGDDDEEEELGSRFHVYSNDNAVEGDGFTGNLLQAMEGNPMAFDTEEHLHSPHSADVRADIQHMNSSHSLFNSSGKRVIEHDNHGSLQALNGSNKRLRINESWDHKPEDFGMCMEQIQQWSERARSLYVEKEQALEQANMSQQFLLSEVEKRDMVIEHLHKSRLDEVQKKESNIYRLERELSLMGSVLEGYRKALKETQKAFADYREKAQLPEEPTYKDTGSGGLMLSAAEIEKLEKAREEEYMMNCLILEQRMREAEEGYRSQFEEHVDKINLLDRKLTALEADAKKLIDLYESRKIQQTGEVPEHAQPLPVTVTEDKLPEVADPHLILQTEETTAEIEETRPEVPDAHVIPQTEETTAEIEETQPEVADPHLIPQTEETTAEIEDTLPEVADPNLIPQTDETAAEIEETRPEAADLHLIRQTEESSAEVEETRPEAADLHLIRQTEESSAEVEETRPAE